MTTGASLTTLPALNPAERAHAERVSEHIRGFIAAQGGVVVVNEYMELS